MKNLRKMLSMLLAVIMVLGMSVTAMADEPYTITIENAVNGHTYEAYQILTGKIDTVTTNGEEEKVLIDPISYGTGVNASDEWGTASELAKKLENGTISATEFATQAADNLTETKADAEAANNEAVITVSSQGYYLIKDKDLATGDVYILSVVNANTTVKTKTEKAPKFEKKVNDINDSTAEEESLKDSADHDIGDNVTFTLTATLPEDYADYEKYTLVFHDELSTGLTFNNDVSVKIGGTETTINAETINNNLTDDCSFDVKIEDLKTAASGLAAGDTIVVTYTAELNENAVIGSTGNPNTACLEYSNNPKYKADGTGDGGDTTDKTVKDTVVVFTYEFDVNKVDQNQNALHGAGFTLYKYDGTDYVAVAQEKVLTNSSKFEFKGLDDGKYKLVESTTPAGYNTAEDIYFTVVAEHSLDSDNPTLTSLTVTRTNADGTEFVEDTDSITVSSEASKIISTTVVNNKGAVLPETGGMGTRVIYLFGGALVIIASVLLITKRRMNSN